MPATLLFGGRLPKKKWLITSEVDIVYFIVLVQLDVLPFDCSERLFCVSPRSQCWPLLSLLAILDRHATSIRSGSESRLIRASSVFSNLFRYKAISKVSCAREHDNLRNANLHLLYFISNSTGSRRI